MGRRGAHGVFLAGAAHPAHSYNVGTAVQLVPVLMNLNLLGVKIRHFPYEK